jgi:hypothetical protein
MQSIRTLFQETQATLIMMNLGREVCRRQRCADKRLFIHNIKQGKVERVLR